MPPLALPWVAAASTGVRAAVLAGPLKEKRRESGRIEKS